MFKKILEDWKYAIGFLTFGFLLISIVFSILIIVNIKNSWNSGTYNTISVNGKSEIKTVPNITNFDFTVSEVSESVELAQKNSAEKINKAINLLKEKGIEEKDIKSISYNINPKYEWIQGVCNVFGCQPSEQKLVGYEVSQTTNVKIRNTEKVGEILSGIGEIGIKNVGGLYFTVDNEEDIKKQALAEAIEDAKNKAQELSKKLGVKLIRIVSFGEENYYSPYPEGR
ncbi:MAG TPA: SIMPL domain-containing protein, partial [Candidatus Paceibacterota bacterium]|nr:SIMPL domain-containing protein [Candidatus Paceibacterota bacterium]